MTLVEAISTAKNGQKVKRSGSKTAGFVMRGGNVVVRLSKTDYAANDWVVSVPAKKMTIKKPNSDVKVKVYKATYIETTN